MFDSHAAAPICPGHKQCHDWPREGGQRNHSQRNHGDPISPPERFVPHSREIEKPSIEQPNRRKQDEHRIGDILGGRHTPNSNRALSAIPAISPVVATRIPLSSIICKANPTSLLLRSNSASTTAVSTAVVPVTRAISGAIFGYLAASITAASTLAFIDTA